MKAEYTKLSRLPPCLRYSPFATQRKAMKKLLIIAMVISFLFLGHIVEAQVGSNWTQVTAAAPWSARWGQAGVEFNGQMWLLGGRDPFHNDVWSSPDGTNWTQVTSAAPWPARSEYGAVVFNGQMWLLGGSCNNGCYLNDVWSSPDGTNWTQVTSGAPWPARFGQAAVVFNGRVWLLGGANAGGYLNDVWSSPDGTNWTQVTSAAPWPARCYYAADVFSGRIWVIGGWRNGALNDVWSSPDGTNWTQVTSTAPWSARALFGSVAFTNQVWVLGGSGASADLNDVWSSSDGLNWTQATAAAQWSARRGQAAVLFNGRMWLLGGVNGGYLNDVWVSPPAAPPAASFAAAPTNGFAPLPVTFTDTSTGSINNWSWNFGDGGTTNLATSNVVYTYKTGGVFTVTEIVTGPGGVSSNVLPSYIIVVNCPTITLSPNGASPTALAGGTAGVAYSQTITASGGVGTYTYATTSGSLPTGLSLSSAGVLSGMPTAAGTYTFTITATDTNGCKGSQAYSLTMTCPTITLSPATLPMPSAGAYYSQPITASGGNGPYTFAETGTLPTGMVLSSGGVLSGIPTETGTFPIMITATDQVTSCTGSRSYTLRVDCPTITLSPSSLPAGTVGTAYSATITGNGGVPSYAFLVISGSLPTGLNLDLWTGVLSGTPTAAGTFTFAVAVFDENGCPGAASYTVQMYCPPITLSALPNGTVMTPYSQTITASGGTAPYTFSVLNGAIPSGLSLSAAGVLSGTPTTATNVTFTLLANDVYSCSGTQQYTVATFGPFEITAIAKESNDILVTWSCLGSHSYVLQSTKSAAMIAQYTTNFVDVSPTILVSGLGPTTTNYLDAGAAYTPVLTAPGGTIVTTSVVPSTVSISAAGTRGITDSLGQALPVGSLVMLGTFSVSEPTIQSNFIAGNISAIMSNFTPYSTSFRVGDGTGLPATWDVSLSAAGFGGQQIYLLATDKPTLAAANHLGIYTAPSWTFPADGSQTNIDLADVTDFVIGGLGGSLTINLPVGGTTYTFNDTAKLSVMPGRILFYRVRLVQ